MGFDITTLLIIVAGGPFGVVLGRFLDETPNWVFYLMVLLLFIVVIYIMTI